MGGGGGHLLSDDVSALANVTLGLVPRVCRVMIVTLFLSVNSGFWLTSADARHKAEHDDPRMFRLLPITGVAVVADGKPLTHFS